MKNRTPLLIAIAIAAAGPFGGASAQTTTDEARALAQAQTAAQLQAAAFVAPTETDVPMWNYFERGYQRTRIETYRAFAADVLRIGEGVRSAPLKVVDTDSARAEAARQNREARLLAQNAYLQAHPSAQAALHDGLARLDDATPTAASSRTAHVR